MLEVPFIVFCYVLCASLPFGPCFCRGRSCKYGTLILCRTHFSVKVFVFTTTESLSPDYWNFPHVSVVH